MKKFLIFLILFIMALFVLAFIQDFNVKATSIEYRNDCKGMDLINTSYCLNKELKSFFFYNISNIGKDLNESEFRRIGGVCSHATLWFLDKFKQINNPNFYTKDVIIDTNETSAHEFLIVSDKTAYCKLDQDKIHCQRFGGSNES